MKSLKKIFTLFALFAMVACLSISSFALEPDTAMEEVSSEPDMAMSEADMEADTILEKAIPEISPEAGIVDPVEPADVYPACDHNYITSPVGSLQAECLAMRRTTSIVALSAVNITTQPNTHGIAKSICKSR